MAEKHSSPMYDTDEYDLITCSLCYETFQDPRGLPCLHSFCCKCLENLVGQTKNACNIPSQLKCPLCLEVHILHKGVAGLPRDVKTIKFLGYREAKRAAIEGNDEDHCPEHCNSPLKFYCKEEKCEVSICEECWMADHADHSVVPLSRRLEEINKKFLNEVESIENCLIEQIKTLVMAKEDHVKDGRALKEEVKAVVIKCKDKLDKVQTNILAAIETNLTEQDENFKTLLVKLYQRQETLDKLKRPLQASCDLGKIEHDNITQIRTLRNDADTCNFSVLKPQIRVNLQMIRDCMSYEVVQKSIFEATGSDPSQVHKIQDHDKRCKAPRHSTGDSNDKVQEEQHTPNPCSTENSEQFSVTLEYKQSWPCRKSSLHSTTVTYLEEHGLVTIREGKLYKNSKKEYLEIIPRGDVHSFHEGLSTVKLNGVEYLAALNSKENEISLFRVRPCYFIELTIPVRYRPVNLLSGTANMLFYTQGTKHKTDHRDQLLCYCTDDKKISWTVSTRVNIRSMCAVGETSEMLDPFVVCAYQCPAVCPMEWIALAAYGKELPHLKWTITYEQLDPDAANFDLRDMAFDGKHLIVLNYDVGVYAVKPDGSVTCKVTVQGNISRVYPRALCFNPKSRCLTAVDADRISEYKIS